MIEGTIKETVTDTEKIYEYTTVCSSGTRANVRVVRPVLSNDEYERRKKEAERELARFAQGVIADGYDWQEFAQSKAQRRKNNQI